MKYKIKITRDYEFNVEADTEDEAIEKALFEAECEGADSEQIYVVLT